MNKGVFEEQPDIDYKPKLTEEQIWEQRRAIMLSGRPREEILKLLGQGTLFDINAVALGISQPDGILPTNPNKRLGKIV